MTRDEFASLALSYLEEATAYAQRLSRRAWDADDLVQGAYELGFRKWNDLSEAGRCRAWLFRIIRNLHIDQARASAARSELRLVGPGDSVAPASMVSAETVERFAARDLEAALSKLSDAHREVILLSDLWGFRYQEIAEITEIPIGTVRSRLSRARSELSQLLSGVEAERSARSGGKL